MTLNDSKQGEVELCLSKKTGFGDAGISEDLRFRLPTSCCSVAADDRNIVIASNNTILFLRFKQPEELTEACSFLTKRISSSQLVLADESHHTSSLMPFTSVIHEEEPNTRYREAHQRKSTTLPAPRASLQIRGQNWPRQHLTGLASKVIERIAEDDLGIEEFGFVRFSDV